MDLLTLLLTLALGLAVGAALGMLWMRGRPSYVDGRLESAEVLQGLDRLHDKMQDLAHQGVSWQSQLREQVLDVRHSTDLLRRETGALSTALANLRCVAAGASCTCAAVSSWPGWSTAATSPSSPASP